MRPHPADGRNVAMVGPASDGVVPESERAAVVGGLSEPVPNGATPQGVTPDQWVSMRRQMEAARRAFQRGADGVVRSFSPRGGELLELLPDGAARVRLRGERAVFDGVVAGEPAATAAVASADARPDASVVFRTAGVGRDELRPLGPRESQSVRPERVTRDFGEGVEEWWRSEEDGFELGWTLARRPEGLGPLRLAVAVDSPWPARVRHGGTAVDFEAPGASDWMIHCTKLAVWDAAGAAVPARLAVEGGAITITVDDTDAVYPVVIDPWIFSSLRTTLRSSTPFAGGRFGGTVAACDDVVVATGLVNGGSGQLDGEATIFSGGDFRRVIPDTAGQNAGAGASFRWISASGDSVSVITGLGNSQFRTTVYERNAGGVESWGAVATVTVDGGLIYSPSEISGPFMAVAVPAAQVGGLSGAGQVQIRRRDAGGPSAWGLVATLDAGDQALEQGLFGVVQALDGGTLVAMVRVSVGEYRFLVFDRVDAAGTQWVRRKVIPLPGISGGLPVMALKGDTLAVGVTGVSAQPVGLYERHLGGANNWGLSKSIAGPPGQDTFGFSLALNGGVLAVGCPGEDVDHDDDPGTPLAPDGGTIRVFARNQNGVNGWGMVEFFKGTEANARMGESVAFNGDNRMYYGLPSRDVSLPNVPDAGVVTAYQLDSGRWNRDFLEAHNQNASDWGASVAVSGGYVLVGAPRSDGPAGVDAGWAFLFKDGVLVKSLLPPSQQVGEQFGFAVAIDGDRLAIGSPLRSGTISPTNYPDLGVVTVFERNKGGADAWGAVKTFSQTNIGTGSTSPRFGSSVSLSGDVLAVGSPEETGLALPGAASKGRVRVFYRNSGGVDAWGQVQSMRADDNGTEEVFGTSVDVSGDTMVAGAPWEAVNGIVRSGAVYLYRRNQGGADAWGRVRKLTADTVKGDAWFGHAVALDGMDLVVGAPHEDRALEPNVGAVYFFAGGQTEADVWVQTRRWQPDEVGTEGLTGFSVDVHDGRSVAGVPGVAATEGAVYVLRKHGQGGALWTAVEEVFGGQESLGESVALDGGLVVAGEPRADINNGSLQTDRGQANTWTLTGIEFVPLAERQADPGANEFGASLALHQHWMAVGAPAEDVAGVVDSGAVYMFHRDRPAPGEYAFVQKLTDLSESGPGSRFGAALALDAHWLMAGLPGAARIQTHYLRILPNPSDSFMWIDSVVLSSGAANGLGQSLALDGGFLVAGAPAHTVSGLAGAGAAYLFERNQSAPNEWGLLKTLTASDPAAGDAFGTSVAASRSLIAVGSPLDNNGEGADAGAVYLFERNQGGVDAWGQVDKLTTGNQAAGDEMGSSVALSASRVLAGAPKSDLNATDAGAAFLFARNTGGANAWGLLKSLVSPAPSSQARFGTAVGLDSEHAVIGEPFADPRGVGNAGVVHLFSRNWLGADSWSPMQAISPTNLPPASRFGNALAWHQGSLAVAAPGNDTNGRVIAYEFGPRRIYHDWASAHGLEGVLALPDRDADFDGQPNLVEMILGSHPGNPASQGQTLLSTQANTLVVTANKNGACPAGTLFTAETSPDLASWSAVAPQNILTDTKQQLAIQIPITPGTRQFARWRAELP